MRATFIKFLILRSIDGFHWITKGRVFQKTMKHWRENFRTKLRAYQQLQMHSVFEKRVWYIALVVACKWFFPHLKKTQGVCEQEHISVFIIINIQIKYLLYEHLKILFPILKLVYRKGGIWNHSVLNMRLIK